MCCLCSFCLSGGDVVVVVVLGWLSTTALGETAEYNTKRTDRRRSCLALESSSGFFFLVSRTLPSFLSVNDRSRKLRDSAVKGPPCLYS